MGESEITKAWKSRYAATRTEVEPVEIALPSGMPAKVKRITLFDLFKLGLIPDSLSPVVAEWFAVNTRAAEHGVTPDQEAKALHERYAEEFVRIRNLVWRLCVVDPEVWETAEEALANPDAIPLSAVSVIDRMFVLTWCQGVSEAVEEFLFRYRQAGVAGGSGEAGVVGDVEGRDGVPPRPAGDAGDRPDDRSVARPAGAPVGAYLG